MSTNHDDWAHLGACLKAERGSRSRADIEKATNVSASMIQSYENGKRHLRPPQKLWDLVNYYRWTQDSLARVLAGGLPTYRPEPATEAERKIADSIERDPVLSPSEKRELLDWLMSRQA